MMRVAERISYFMQIDTYIAAPYVEARYLVFSGPTPKVDLALILVTMTNLVGFVLLLIITWRTTMVIKLWGELGKYGNGLLQGFAFISIFALVILQYAIFYRDAGIVDTVRKCSVNDGASALYFSITTITTLGYGDLVPEPASRLIAASEAVIGYVFFAALIAGFGIILAPFLVGEYQDKAADTE